MLIDKLNIKPTGLPISSPKTNVSDAGNVDFGDTVKNAVKKVNELQNNADQMAVKLASGDPVEIHQAMIEMQKASTALQFTVQVRNKILDAYQEIMKMQV